MATLDWGGRNILVTGATGFIGSHLTERLLSMGAHVRAMAHGTGPGHERFLSQCPETLRPRLDIRGGDLTDRVFVRDVLEGVDTIFHLGAITSVAYSYKYPAETFRTNVMGTYNLCEAARESGIRRMVHPSSGGHYGHAENGSAITEDHPLTGCNPYTASKIGADACCETFYLSYDFPVSICRIFNTYGPRIGQFLIMPTIITQLVASDTIKLGDLRPRRNFTYVDDIVTAFIRMAEEDAVVGQVVHFGSDKGVTMGELVDVIADIMGKKVTVVTDPSRLRPAKSEIQCTLTDASKAAKLLNWRPTVSLRDGLASTCDWIAAGGYDGVRPNQVV